MRAVIFYIFSLRVIPPGVYKALWHDILCHTRPVFLLPGGIAATALFLVKLFDSPAQADLHAPDTGAVAMTTYTTVADGNWNNASTWMGGLIPASTINATDVVHIGHVVTYNVGSDLEVYGTVHIVNGTFRTALTDEGSNRSVFIRPGAEWNMCNARFYLPIKDCGYGCNTGSNLGGNFNNQNGAITIYNSTVEIAQNWNDNSSSGNGSRTFVGGCLKLGENFQNKGSVDLYDATCLEMGLHGSGNWLNEYQVTFLNNCVIKLEGSGNFENKGIFGAAGGTGSPDIAALGISNGNVTNDAPWAASILNFCGGTIGGSMAADFTGDIANNNTPAACTDVANTTCDTCPAGICQLTVSISILQEPSCHPGGDGIIALSIDSSTATLSCAGDTTLTYQWSTLETQDTLHNLPAGTYTVTVTDASGCTATSAITIDDPCLGCPDCVLPGQNAEVFYIGPHAIIYSGRIFDTSECRTYFLYCIINDVSGGSNDISHTAFGDSLCALTCLDDPDSAMLGIWSLDSIGNVILGPDCGNSVHGEDPTTGICGVKHDSSAGGGCYEPEDCLDSDLQVGHLYLSVAGNVPESTVTIALKYGPNEIDVEVPGPGNCTDVGCVECVIGIECDNTVLRSGTFNGCSGADAPPPLAPYSVFDTVSVTGSCSVQFSMLTDIDATDPCNLIVTYTYYGWNDADRDSIRDPEEPQDSCMESFIVFSDTSPSIVCPSDISIEGCDVDDITTGGMSQFAYSPDDVTVSVAAFMAEAGMPAASDDCLFMVTYRDTAAGSCPVVVTRTWKVADLCGNVASCTQRITIDDTTPPMITCAPLNFSCIGEVPPVLDLVGVSYDDNCDVTVLPIIVNATNECPRTITRTYRATDGCGNSASCVQVIIVDDNTFPNLDCPDPVSLEGCGYQAILDAGLTQLNINTGPPAPISYEDFIQEAGPPSVSDNCSFDITYQDNIISTSCPLYIRRKYRVVDVCNNTVSCTQEIIIEDSTAPALIDEDCSTLNMIVDGCLTEGENFDPSGIEGDILALYVDQCSNVTVAYLSTDEGLENSDCAWSFTYTYRISDTCSNSVICSVTRSGGDMTDPQWIMIPADVTVECDGAGNTVELNSWLEGFSGTDNCGTATVTHNFGEEGHTLSDACGMTGSVTVTFVLADECGNSIVKAASFTIEDTTPPMLNTHASGMTVECDGSGNTAQLSNWLSTHGGAIASDLCGNVTWSYTPDPAVLSDLCVGTGSVTVTFTATDECGLTNTTTATFTIEDTTPPVIDEAAGDMTVECDGAGNTAQLANWLSTYGGATASDACGNVTWSYTPDPAILSDLCAETGSVTVIFSVTDACGLTNTTTATFTIEDTTPPVIDEIAGDMTVECDGFGNTAQLADWLSTHGGATASDACGNVTWSYTPDPAILSDLCAETGSVVVTFTATDACDLTNTTTATFTIEDTTPPVIDEEAGDMTVECDGSGNVSQLANWLATHGGAIASDACGTVTWSHSPDPAVLGDLCAETGSVMVTFTATDECGHVATTNAQFAITDTEAPHLVDAGCGTLDEQGVIAPLSEAEEFDPVTLENAVFDLYSDDCGALSVEWIMTVPGENNSHCAWSFMYTYLISDACSNSVTCTVTRSGGLNPCPWPSATVFVSHQKTAGAQSGIDWTNALLTIEEALQVAALYPEVEEIWVAGGEYTLPMSSLRSESFELISNIKLMGGFNGLIEDISDRVPFATTVLSGDIGVDGDHSDNTYHVVRVGAGVTGAVLDGLTISEGNANGLQPDNRGAAILNEGQLTIIDCLIHYFDATEPGKAVHSNGGGQVTMKGSTILQE